MPIKDKEKRKEYNADYRLMNWEKIRAYENRKEVCQYCGREYTHGNRAQHFRTDIHARRYSLHLFNQLPFN
jgi:hypothetical protein